MTEIFEHIISGKYKNVWIYGAGKDGKKLLNDFNFFNISINGIVISRYDGTVIPNTSVCELSEIKTSSNETVFIITSSAKFHNDIIKNLETHGFYNYIIWDTESLCRLWKLTDYHFIDRRRNNHKCCFILAGYKEFLWQDTLERFACFTPNDIDVCIISSGVYIEALDRMAEKNGWSYLSTKINSVTLAQNAAYAIFDKYEWVYKADEDMFVTEGTFEKLYSAYLETEKKSEYVPGMVAPLIPVNGYGYGRVLNKLGKMKDYENSFGRINIGGNPNSEIEKNPEAAVFMWKNCPQIDELNRLFLSDKKTDLCCVRFSIGFVLLRHSLWEDMQGFTVSGNADMGTDEEELCAQCMNKSKAIIISTNTVIGHFAFGRQTSRMKKFYFDNPAWFKIRKACYEVCALKKYGSVAICGFRREGRKLYDSLIKNNIHVSYIIERNYEALSQLERKIDVPIVGFNEKNDFYSQADVIIHSGDLQETIVRDCFELAGIHVPFISNMLE